MAILQTSSMISSANWTIPGKKKRLAVVYEIESFISKLIYVSVDNPDCGLVLESDSLDLQGA